MQFSTRAALLPKMVDSTSYYAEYHGHPIEDLKEVVHSLRESGKKRLIFLVGDSTMDNKYYESQVKY